MLLKIIEVLQYGACLAFFVVFNILLGKKIADIKAEYNRTVLIDGIYKSVIITLFLFGSAIIGQVPVLSQLQFASPIDGNQISIGKLINLIMIGGIIYYATLCFKKVISLLKLPTNIQNAVSDDEEVDDTVDFGTETATDEEEDVGEFTTEEAQ